MAILPAIMLGASILGPMLSKGGKGAADERSNQNDAQLQRDRLAMQGHQTDTSALLQALQQNESATMNRAQLGISAPQDRTRQALLGSLLSNAQTVKGPGGRSVGGIDLSSLLSGARTAGGELTSQATKALQTGSDIPAFTDATSRLTKAPSPTAYQQPGKVESVLSGGGLLASLLSAASPLLKGRGADPGAGPNFNF